MNTAMGNIYDKYGIITLKNKATWVYISLINLCGSSIFNSNIVFNSGMDVIRM